MWLRVIWAASILSLSAGAVQGQSQRAPDAAKAVAQQLFGDWAYRCARSNGTDAKTCELAQSVRVKRDGKLLEVISLAVSRARDKAKKVEWALVAVTPLDVHLPSRFGISVGEKTVTTAAYRNCNRFGCWAVVALDASLLKQFQAQSEAAALFRLLDGKTVRIVFSLKGFREGFRALKSGKTPDKT